MPAAKYGQQRKNRRKHPGGPKKNRFFLRKFAILQSWMRRTAKRHGFLHIDAHLVAKGALGHMGQIQPISAWLLKMLGFNN